MGTSQSKTLPKDFDAPALVKTTKNHEERLSGLEKQISALVAKVGDNESFAKSFAEAQKNTKIIDESITVIIDGHDNHKFKVNGLALAKFLGTLIIGAILGALIDTAIRR